MMLKIKDLYVGYGDLIVIHGISIEIGSQEIVALIGSNGAGKTTTIKTISGLLHPKSGEIEFKGVRIDNLKVHEVAKKGIAHVPEGKHIFTRLSVEDNLILGSYLNKYKKFRSKNFKKVYSMFPRLYERRNQVAGTLSGGEQQMLAIARGMMSKPKLLMLDELSLGLMPALVEKVMEAVVNVNKKGTTILLVEQMVQEALEIADRGYVIQTGRIIQSGKAVELLESDNVRKAYMGM